MESEKYMELAIELAKKGVGFTNPNPLVGAVIVKNHKIIGKGYHEKYGKLHAERNALASCTESPEGATIYVTLEPCCHYGKTPPCTEALIENKIAKVVIGSMDPNPLVRGKGVKILQDAGIEVVCGFMEKACDQLNKVFFHYITTSLPYVVMKYAMTMDGKIATSTGLSQWITSEAARENVHRDRHRYSSIMVGVGTVLADDPLLTCRLPQCKNPIRIVCDSKLRTPLDCQLVTTTDQAETIIATCCRDKARQQPYMERGVTILEIPSNQDGQIDLNQLMEALGRRGIDSILLEGGSSLNWSALESGIVSLVQTYIAPKIFGGAKAKTPIEGLGVETPSAAFQLANRKVTTIGEDLLIESEVISCLQES